MKNQSLSNKWISLFVNGIIALIVGTVFIFVPEAVYVTIIQVFGALLLIGGIGFIFSVVRKNAEGGMHIMGIVQGIINIGVGIFMILQPGLIFKFTMTFIAIWLIISGAIQLYDSHSMRNVMNHYKILMIWGFINIALGVIIILVPKFPFLIFGYIAYVIAVVMFIYAGIFYGYRNHVPGGNKDIEDAEIVD
ncbi:MAG: DUF308 domain-containing protein [Bacteroidales bacterium]|nr:DUF308 domain-containing protein [Bacteroidales bacterium]